MTDCFRRPVRRTATARYRGEISRFWLSTGIVDRTLDRANSCLRPRRSLVASPTLARETHRRASNRCDEPPSPSPSPTAQSMAEWQRWPVVGRGRREVAVVIDLTMTRFGPDATDWAWLPSVLTAIRLKPASFPGQAFCPSLNATAGGDPPLRAPANPEQAERWASSNSIRPRTQRQSPTR
jgi:hypothetical protein